MHRRWPGLLTLALLLAVVVMSGALAQAKSEHYLANPTSKASSPTESVHESVSAQLTGHNGATELAEQGVARGTQSCPVKINIKLAYTKSYITFYCGTYLAGSGTTAFYVSGQTAYFHGTLLVTRGSGHYRHSAGSRLSITGTLHRGTYALSCEVAGTISI